MFYTNTICFTQNITTYKNNQKLAQPVQALFAACRRAVSMVAGGTRRRRLNGYDFERSKLPAWVADKFKNRALLGQEKQWKQTSSTCQVCGASISRPAKQMDSDKWPERSILATCVPERLLYKTKFQKTQRQLQANHART